MSSFPILSNEQIEQISQILGEEVTGSELSEIFNQCNITDNSGHSTKWRRIKWSLIYKQQIDRCGNNIANFIKTILSPVKYVNNNSRFENARRQINAILLFSGVELTASGKYVLVERVSTISESQKRANIIMTKLKERNIHPQVIKYCNSELMQDNYFHAVFEATKSLAQIIRDKTGIQKDGSALVDEAFAINNPYLVFNTLQTETEQTEHKGFALLLKGCFSAIRNPRAHEPKILWNGEDDVIDYFSLISMLYKKLENVIVVKKFN